MDASRGYRHSTKHARGYSQVGCIYMLFQAFSGLSLCLFKLLESYISATWMCSFVLFTDVSGRTFGVMYDHTIFYVCKSPNLTSGHK